MKRTTIIMLIAGGLIALIAGVLAGFQVGGLLNAPSAFQAGYRQAYEDHRSGQIDCVVRVKHPEWLEQGK